ncbi:MAG: hypothetical protein ACSLE8_00680 [Rhodococcus sp. (in: high G+C Gram-positive bacteria)]
MPTDEEILKILQIGHDSSIRGLGLSLNQALKQARYRELRNTLSVSDLLPVIDKNPQLIEQWIMYSEDKRTDGGWYLSPKAAIGTIAGDRIKFRGMQEAVAEYVLRELDFWS